MFLAFSLSAIASIIWLTTSLESKVAVSLAAIMEYFALRRLAYPRLRHGDQSSQPFLIFCNYTNMHKNPLEISPKRCYYDYTKKAPTPKWMLQVYSDIVLTDTAYPVDQTG